MSDFEVIDKVDYKDYEYLYDLLEFALEKLNIEIKNILYNERKLQ